VAVVGIVVVDGGGCKDIGEEEWLTPLHTFTFKKLVKKAKKIYM